MKKDTNQKNPPPKPQLKLESQPNKRKYEENKQLENVSYKRQRREEPKPHTNQINVDEEKSQSFQPKFPFCHTISDTLGNMFKEMTQGSNLVFLQTGKLEYCEELENFEKVVQDSISKLSELNQAINEERIKVLGAIQKSMNIGLSQESRKNEPITTENTLVPSSQTKPTPSVLPVVQQEKSKQSTNTLVILREPVDPMDSTPLHKLEEEEKSIRSTQITTTINIHSREEDSRNNKQTNTEDSAKVEKAKVSIKSLLNPPLPEKLDRIENKHNIINLEKEDEAIHVKNVQKILPEIIRLKKETSLSVEKAVYTFLVRRNVTIHNAQILSKDISKTVLLMLICSNLPIGPKAISTSDHMSNILLKIVEGRDGLKALFEDGPEPKVIYDAVLGIVTMEDFWYQIVDELWNPIVRILDVKAKNLQQPLSENFIFPKTLVNERQRWQTLKQSPSSSKSNTRF